MGTPSIRPWLRLPRRRDLYETLLADLSDDTLRTEIDNFDGSKTSRGVFIVKYVLSGHAAYRTQLFLYLKSCGCDELNTRNLWGGTPLCLRSRMSAPIGSGSAR